MRASYGQLTDGDGNRYCVDKISALERNDETVQIDCSNCDRLSLLEFQRAAPDSSEYLKERAAE